MKVLKQLCDGADSIGGGGLVVDQMVSGDGQW